MEVNSKLTGPQRLLHSLAGGGRREESLWQLGSHYLVHWEVVRTRNPGAVCEWETALSSPRPPFRSGLKHSNGGSRPCNGTGLSLYFGTWLSCGELNPSSGDPEHNCQREALPLLQHLFLWPQAVLTSPTKFQLLRVVKAHKSLQQMASTYHATPSPYDSVPTPTYEAHRPTYCPDTPHALNHLSFAHAALPTQDTLLLLVLVSPLSFGSCSSLESLPFSLNPLWRSPVDSHDGPGSSPGQHLLCCGCPVDPPVSNPQLETPQGQNCQVST